MRGLPIQAESGEESEVAYGKAVEMAYRMVSGVESLSKASRGE
jgi:hypothetical protein